MKKIQWLGIHYNAIIHFICIVSIGGWVIGVQFVDIKFIKIYLITIVFFFYNYIRCLFNCMYQIKTRTSMSQFFLAGIVQIIRFQMNVITQQDTTICTICIVRILKIAHITGSRLNTMTFLLSVNRGSCEQDFFLNGLFY